MQIDVEYVADHLRQIANLAGGPLGTVQVTKDFLRELAAQLLGEAPSPPFHSDDRFELIRMPIGGQVLHLRTSTIDRLTWQALYLQGFRAPLHKMPAVV